MKVLIVFGTRPEAIKLAPLIRALDGHRARVETRICVTAQHREMLDQVLSLFAIVPHHDLGVMDEDQTPTQVAAAVLTRLDAVLRDERPEWVVVQGDTTSAAAASLAAFYAGVRVAHVEAGLRTGNPRQPYPEEINRRITGLVADLHLAPTARARANLLREGVRDASILVTGNTVIDALRWIGARIPEDARVPYLSGTETKLVLLTAHRRENFGEPLENICLAVREVARRRQGAVRFVYPVHPNPRVLEPVRRHLAGVDGVTLTGPLDYDALVRLLKRAHVVLTDSGGLQEEAPVFGVPVLVLREVTERPEGLEAGTARLLGTDRDRIVDGLLRVLDHDAEHDAMARAVNPFGDGYASERIVSALLGEPVDPFVVGSGRSDPERPA